MLKKIYTSNAPAAIGPYSQAILFNELLFSSGQIPVDPATGEVVQGDITVQAEQVMKNVGAVLKKQVVLITDAKSVPASFSTAPTFFMTCSA